MYLDRVSTLEKKNNNTGHVRYYATENRCLETFLKVELKT